MGADATLDAVMITIGDTVVSSDGNGLWHALPPVDATGFTIATAAGQTNIDFGNPQVATHDPGRRPPKLQRSRKHGVRRTRVRSDVAPGSVVVDATRPRPRVCSPREL